MALIITKENYEAEVLKSNIPVMVDFYAEWCGPCKAIGPVVDEIAKEVEGKAKVVKIDVDQSRDLAAKYNIMTVPTFLFFKDGTLKETIVGVVSKDELLNNLLK